QSPAHSFCRRSIACCTVLSPSTSAKSRIIVVPPNNAAWLTRSGPSVMFGWVWPGTGIGQRQWTCGSMPPGMTIWPVASITRPPSGARVPGAPIATIFSPWIPISAFSAPEGRTAVPPVTTMSSMGALPLCLVLQDRFADQVRRGEGEMPENLLGRDVMHDKDEAAAMVRIRPAVEPFRREHRVLRGLHDCRSAGAIDEFDKAFDAQQIAAAVARQTAQGAREIEAADGALKGDGEHRDAVRVRMTLAAKPPPVLGSASDLPPPHAGEGSCSSPYNSLPHLRGRVGVGAL